MYVDALLVGDWVHVAERHPDGSRVIRKHPAPYELYTPDPGGKYQSMTGERLKREQFSTGQKFRKRRYELEGLPVWESDVRAEFRVIEREYKDQVPPALNLALIDIEVDVNPEGGFPSYVNAYGPINAVTVHERWRGASTTLVVPPPGMSMDEADALIAGVPDSYVVSDETELLVALLEVIKDADVTTGWYSEKFDIPYIIARIRTTLGDEDWREFRAEESFNPSKESREWLQKLCLFDRIPEKREVERFGNKEFVFDLPGKPHLDYLQLYQKFTFVEQHSYKLNHILQVEVNQTKVQFDGPIWDLYRNDFRLFTEYNKQDVEGMVAMDAKLRFVDLANAMAHMAGVLLPQVFGSVAIIGQAILLELHAQGLIAPTRPTPEDTGPVAGAFVHEPRGGMEEWVTGIDLASEYPTIIRLLNMGLETVVGQFDLSSTEAYLKKLVDDGKAEGRQEALGYLTGVLEYHAIVDNGGDPMNELTLRLEDGTEIRKTGEEWNEYFRQNELCVSANGTVFDTSRESILAFCLTKWFKERKTNQKKSKQLFKEADTLKKAGGPDYKELEEQAHYYNRLQHVQKIFLNSTYGALLNRFFRFADPRFGQSVTLSGRVITKHMARKANEVITGKYEFGEALIYGDTDSAYLTLAPLMREPDIASLSETEKQDMAVELADIVAEEVNQSFPAKMAEMFFVTEEKGQIVTAGREIVARRGLFKNAKKRYALAVYDKEGLRKPELKIMGMETQRSDTPKYIQDFLKEGIRLAVAEGQGRDRLFQHAQEFRAQFRKRDPWTLGRPCRVSNLTVNSRALDVFYGRVEAEQMTRTEKAQATMKKPQVHYSVTASYNTNRYIDLFNDRTLPRISDGDKVEIIDLTKGTGNPLEVDTIAIPVGITSVPKWMKDLPYDTRSAEEKLVDKKIDNVFGVLGWDFKPPTTASDDVFE